MNTLQTTTSAESTPRFELPADDAMRPPGPRGLRATARAMIHLRGDFLSFLESLQSEYAGESLDPVVFTLGGQRMAFVSRPAHIHRVLTDTDTFTRTVKYMNAFRRALGYNIITVPNSQWKPVRKRTASYFSGKALHEYADVVVQAIDYHSLPGLERLARSGERFELFDEMLDVASIAAYAAFLGERVDTIPPEAYRALNRIFCFVRRNMFTYYLPPLWVPTPQNRDLRRDLELVRGDLRQRIEAQRDRQTMMGDIVRTHTGADGETDLQKVLDETIANLVGGSETTIILMAWTLYYLVQEPAVEAKLLDEIAAVVGDEVPTLEHLKRMPYLKLVITEALRLRSPAYVSSRMTTRDVSLGGFRLENDTMVFVSQYVTHRDPSIWSEPEAFRPERFAEDSPEALSKRRGEMPYFPFGGGAFFCLGMHYAVNEAELLVIMLLRRFRFEIADRESFDAVGLDARLTLRPDRPIDLHVYSR
ncbi:MAG: cytochrome P450 [Acidobacteriota bacterium]